MSNMMKKLCCVAMAVLLVLYVLPSATFAYIESPKDYGGLHSTAQIWLLDIEAVDDGRIEGKLDGQLELEVGKQYQISYTVPNLFKTRDLSFKVTVNDTLVHDDQGEQNRKKARS